MNQKFEGTTKSIIYALVDTNNVLKDQLNQLK